VVTLGEYLSTLCREKEECRLILDYLHNKSEGERERIARRYEKMLGGRLSKEFVQAMYLREKLDRHQGDRLTIEGIERALGGGIDFEGRYGIGEGDSSARDRSARDRKSDREGSEYKDKEHKEHKERKRDKDHKEHKDHKDKEHSSKHLKEPKDKDNKSHREHKEHDDGHRDNKHKDRDSSRGKGEEKTAGKSEKKTPRKESPSNKSPESNKKVGHDSPDKHRDSPKTGEKGKRNHLEKSVERSLSASKLSVDEAVGRVCTTSPNKHFYVVKDPQAPVERQYKIVAEIYADKHTLQEMRPFIENGQIEQVLGFNGVPGPRREISPESKRKKILQELREEDTLGETFESFPTHHYAKAVVGKGEFDDSFEEWVLDPALSPEEKEKIFKKAQQLKEEKQKKKQEEESKILARKKTDAYYQLNKHRLPQLESKNKDLTNKNISFEEKLNDSTLHKKKDSLVKIDVQQINTLHQADILKSAEAHADKPLAVDKPSQAVETSLQINAASTNAQKSTTSDNKEKPAETSPAAPTQTEPNPSSPPKVDEFQSKPPVVVSPPEPVQTPPPVSVTADHPAKPPETPKQPSPPADAPKPTVGKLPGTGLGGNPFLNKPAAETPQPVQSAPVEKVPENKPSALKTNPFLNKTSAPTPPQQPPTAPVSNSSLGTNPFLNKAPANDLPPLKTANQPAKPPSTTANLSGALKPATTTSSPQPKPEDKPAGETQPKPNPFGALLKPASTQPKPAQPVAAEAPSGGVKNNPFLAKKPTPTETKPPSGGATPKVPTPVGEKLKDNPFMAKNNAAPSAPSPPKTPTANPAPPPADPVPPTPVEAPPQA
jgi:hypothetical protein